MNKYILMFSLLAIPMSAFAKTVEEEKAAAMAEPYASDYGPNDLDSKYLATLSKKSQETYKNVFKVKCAQCHTAARPLWSQFHQVIAPKAEREAKVAMLKKANPDVSEIIWQPEGNIWQRYVKRMMAKPGCGISKEEGKAIFFFLREHHDKLKMKGNKVSPDWIKMRQAHLDQFKKEHPERYKVLYEKH